ncbi:uncharacterized protein LOC131164347 [Malania oleifera]|uniref:uncharacterized protein LOC131164347 n=1 Tax=Malania oleifera TaxID=397392 RepID=UPI0025AE5FE6|nr:uncharacterized protein LOC131164347 [Malania oleifera]
MEFRPRDYAAEEGAYSLPRVTVETHPLSPLPCPSSHHQVNIVDHEDDVFFDPLRAPDANSMEDVQDAEGAAAAGFSSSTSLEPESKEWTSFKRFLMQRFSVTKMVSISSISDAIVKSGKALEKLSINVHSEELDDPQKNVEEGIKVITRQEYISRLHELKDEITHAWHADDRVTSLKLSIKVAKLLMDTSVLQFYPALFVLVVDIMDMLGDMVWERIRQKAEFAEDGTKICPLAENFVAGDICFDAKETCTNWFYKIGSIRELLPRIYLELAILPCWRFLLDRPIESLQRLVLMTRGLADPLASAYCRLYMVHRAQKLPLYDTEYLVACTNDIKLLLLRAISAKDTTHGKFSEKKRLLINLMEPAVEYIMKCLFKDAYQRQTGNVLVELGLGKNQSELFGDFPCVSIVLHHLLKELPTDIVCSNALKILHLIERSDDCSFDQSLNYRLLGFKLCESRYQMDRVSEVVDKVMEVVSQYDSLDDYLKVVDAYVDIILQNKTDNDLDTILEGISKRACERGISENELGGLQSIFLKVLSHFTDVEDVFALNHFVEILDAMHGSSRSIVNLHILNMATRAGYIRDPTTIHLLFEISQSLHDSIDFSSVKDDNNQQSARLISRFVHMVDYGEELERHLTFLVECRGAFGTINELKETLIHSSNCLAVKAIKDTKKHLNFVKACVAFSEVTIPSISGCIKQLNLYLETAEVALLSGLISHSNGLIDSAICCLQSLDLMDGRIDVDGLLSLIRKLCSCLVMVPGNPNQGISHFPKCIVSLISSQSWITPKMRTEILCAIVSLLATLSQNKLPYHSNNREFLGNHLFFDDLFHAQELGSLSEFVLHNLVDAIQQETYQAARGVMALEACNCIVSSVKMGPKISPILSRLLETAKLCLNANDRFLLSTLKVLDEHFPISPGAASSIAIASI